MCHNCMLQIGKFKLFRKKKMGNFTHLILCVLIADDPTIPVDWSRISEIYKGSQVATSDPPLNPPASPGCWNELMESIQSC